MDPDLARKVQIVQGSKPAHLVQVIERFERVIYDCARILGAPTAPSFFDPREGDPLRSDPRTYPPNDDD